MIRLVVAAVQSHASTEPQNQYNVKPRLGQGRAGIKKKMLRFPIPWPCDKPE